jgi:aldose 1-epimerase
MNTVKRYRPQGLGGPSPRERPGLSRVSRLAIVGAASLLAISGRAQAATVSRTIFGTSAKGEVVELISLHNTHGMTVRFSTRGGSITEISAPDRTGRIQNLVLGRADFRAWENGGNAIMGRYANRISGGGFTLDGVFYRLEGARPDTHVVIHGGPNGFSRRLWKAETFARGGRAGAVLSYVSPDDENGFPGELRVTVTYSLGEDDVLRLDYRATTSRPTVVNLTNHTAFNLGGDDSGPVYDEVLQVFASRFTPTDDKQIPTGEIAPVDGGPLDFRKPTRIGDRISSADPQMVIARGLDHNLVLDAPARPGDPVVAARLYDPKSGRRMEVRTTEPGVQIYVTNDDGSRLGANGRTLRQGDGICFETEHFPDSPNQPAFPSTVLRPGEVYHTVTEFAFSTDAEPPPAN